MDKKVLLSSKDGCILIFFESVGVGSGLSIVNSFLLFSNIFIIVFIVVVFPVPGPPVTITTPFSIASLTARTWFWANFIFSSFSTNLISSSIFISKFSNSACDNFIICLQTPFSDK